MAKNPNFIRNMVDKFAIKGHLSEDGRVITYINDDKEEAQIDIEKCLKSFRNEEIELTIAVKMSQDLSGSVED